jgi:hypothetical protein
LPALKIAAGTAALQLRNVVFYKRPQAANGSRVKRVDGRGIKVLAKK